jgi:hypothetical protein
MWKSPGWALGVLVLVAAGGVMGGRPLAAGSPVAAKPPAIKVNTVGQSPVPITWAQGRATFPSRARIPGWLPPGVAHRSLYYDGDDTLDAYWMGPQYKWSLDVTEYPGTELDVVAPNQTSGTVGGIRALIATWYSTPGGAYLTNIAFALDGNTYDVNGINLSLAVTMHVAISLIHP